MDSQATKSANLSSYNAIAAIYDENYGEITAAKEYLEYLINCYKDHEHTSILDLGCGSGGLLKILEDRLPKAELTGVDFSPELLSIAKDKLRRTKLICEDFSIFDTKQKYDAVIATFSLIHSTDEELVTMIPKIFNMLTPGGYFYAAFILGEGEKMEPEALDSTQKTYFNFHSQEYLVDLMKHNKFKIVKQKIVHSEDVYENEDDLYLLLQS